jgi:ABC-2 type transport system ATP-binding protein
MVVETEHLTKRFRRTDVVRDLSLRVPEGSAFALIGPNGAGKTTTIRLLLNILRPSAGRARLFGEDSSKLNPRSFQRIGCVSENQRLPKRLTVEQYFSYLRPLYTNWDLRLEAALREQLDLPPDRALGKLSHGMRMKTILAAALSFRPQLLILDEPLSGLDPLTRDEVIEGMLRLADETTVFISSHELSEIESFTTDIAFLDKGSLTFQESIDTLRDRFREVVVVLADEKRLDRDLPQHWKVPNVSGHTLRFVESEYKDDQLLLHELTKYFGPVRFDAEPMSLRDIAKTLMVESPRGSY